MPQHPINHIIPILCLQVFKLCYGVSKHAQVLVIHVSEIKLILVKEMPVKTLDPFMVIGEQRIHLFHPASHASVEAIGWGLCLRTSLDEVDS